MPRFFDVHTHLHDSRIAGDAGGIMERASAAGVRYAATCATRAENFSATGTLAREDYRIIPCFGIHPWFLESLGPDWERDLGEQLTRLPSGVGETGLDFMDRGADRDLQMDVFKRHLALALDLGRPINIHIRKAWDAFVHLLKRTGPLPAGGVVHSYSGSADLTKVLISYNLFISFSGAATRPNAKKAVRSLKAVPLDRILFETDTPDLFPSLEDGSAFQTAPLNEPRYVRDIVSMCAQRRGTPFETLAEYAYGNALKLFGPVMPDGEAGQRL